MTKLIKNEQKLIQALSNLDIRNQVIHNLNDAGNTNPFRLVMAIWLGSNECFSKLESLISFNVHSSYIWAGYYCIVTIDKAICLLGEQNNNQAKADIKHLRKCQKAILLYFNRNYQLLRDKPIQLFQYFESQIEELTTTEGNQPILEKMKAHCLQNLQLVLQGPNIYSQEQKTIANLQIVKQSGLGVILNRILTAQFKDKMIHPSHRHAQSNFSIDKILIPTKDGLIIDGLYVRRRKSHCKGVILALVGHFPNEDSYISNHVTQFQQLFDWDIMFINHRNYSFNAAQKANHILEIADDVVCFAKHFRRKKRQLVLYGMCGGAAHMLLAAQQLRHKKIPFKLIVDRFSQDYCNWVEYKTIQRRADLTPNVHYPNKILNAIFNSNLTPMFIFLFSSLIFVLLKVLLTSTHSNIDFGKILNEIPEEDLLVLQAKSHQRLVNGEPVLQDIYICPDNDLRAVHKERRQQNKANLRELIKISNTIAEELGNASDLKSVFEQFKDCFVFFLGLINNEKLTIPNIKNLSGIEKPKDGHSKRLYHLTTRSCNQKSDAGKLRYDISTFVQGFYKRVAQNWCCNLQHIKAFSVEQISLAIESLNMCQDEFNYSELLVKHLYSFFEELVNAQKLVYILGKRAVVMGCIDLSAPITDLVSSDFFQNLSVVSPTFL